jgi:hypothetical protein
VDVEWELGQASLAFEELASNRDLIKGLIRMPDEPQLPADRAVA